MRHGQNSSSNPVQAVIEYGRMTNFLAKSLANYMGKFVGQNQTINANDPLRSAVVNVLSTFLEALRVQGQIDSYQIVCDLTNNSANSIAAHYLYAQVKVRYLSSVKFFVLNLQGGTTVVTVGNSLGDILQP
jgi:phage tail sheath protein FI